MKMTELAVNDPVIAERSSPLSGSPDVVPCNGKIANTMCEISESELLSVLTAEEIESHDVAATLDKNALTNSQQSESDTDDNHEESSNSEEIVLQDVANESVLLNDAVVEIVDEFVHINADLENADKCNDTELCDNPDEQLVLASNGGSKVNEMYLPDVVPAFADNSTTTDVIAKCNSETLSENDCSQTRTVTINDVIEETFENICVLSVENNDSNISSPLRSVLKKGSSGSKKNLRVTFSESEVFFVERVVESEPSNAEDLNTGEIAADWDQWEAFSNALKLSLSSFSADDLACTLTAEETGDDSVEESIKQIISKAVNSDVKHGDRTSVIENDQNANSALENGDKNITPMLLANENSYYQSLTEANVRKHESLLINQHDNRESDSESASSQDTIIMMTTEESIRNQELIELSQRRYKQLVQGSSSSSSHESDEAISQTNLVMRSNSSVRRCLERTALRRSLTRCAEIRRKNREDLAAKREKKNSSLIEKLKVLCDVSTLQHNEENATGSSLNNCSLNDGIPRFDLQQMQKLMTRNSPIHKLYSSTNEISVPGDVRQWKIFSKLPADAAVASARNLTSPVIPCQPFDGPSFDTRVMCTDDDGAISGHVSLNASKMQNTSNLFEGYVEDANAAELEYFVQQDQDRTERLKRRYNSNDDFGDESGYRRPSVRGIRPKFSSTTEILDQLQKQAFIPKLVQSSRSHLTWPYVETSTSSDSSMKSQHSLCNFQNLYYNKGELETVMEHEAVYGSPNMHTYGDHLDAPTSMLRSHEKMNQSYELPVSQNNTVLPDSIDDHTNVSATYHFSSRERDDDDGYSLCPPYIPPPAPPYLQQFSEESYVNSYPHVTDINNHFHSPSPQSNIVFPVHQNKTSSSSFMFDV